MNLPNWRSTSPQTKKTVEALWRIQKIILNTLDFNQVASAVVNGLLTELGYLDLGYRIIVLCLVDTDKKILKRISLSQTKEAAKALALSPVSFHKIEIPLEEEENILIKTLAKKEPLTTYDWYDVLRPVLTQDETRKSQVAAGIKTSMIYPVIVRDQVIGVLIFSMVKSESEVSSEEKDLLLGFTDVVGLAVQNSKLYSELEKTSQDLKAVNLKLQELDIKKDEFVSLASHELRTPMTAIRSYLWLALAGKGGPLNEKQKYYLDRSYNSTVRLIRLVNDMLNISRVEAGRITLNMQKIQLSEFTKDVIAEVKPRADELGIKVINKFDPESPLPDVLGDTDKLKEVLINLVGNSLKFTPKGGSVTIWFSLDNNQPTIHVTDTGEGIGADDVPKLFQKFGLIEKSYVTNQSTSQGTGLGLYICKSIIELHGGKIWAESGGKGKGSTFSFALKVFNPSDKEKFDKAQVGKESIGLVPNVI